MMNPIFIDVFFENELIYTYNAGYPLYGDAFTVAILKAEGAKKVFCPRISGVSYQEQLNKLVPDRLLSEYATKAHVAGRIADRKAYC